MSKKIPQVAEVELEQADEASLDALFAPENDAQADTVQAEQAGAEQAQVAKKGKKAELIALYGDLPSEGLPMTVEAFSSLPVGKMRSVLKTLIEDPEALDTPEVTGFNSSDPIHATVAEVEKLESEGDAVKYIASLKEDVDFNFFKIGGALAAMQAKGWTGEYPDLWAFVEATIGIKARKARYLIAIYHALIGCGATWAEAKPVGWSKLALLASILAPENYKALFEQAASSTWATVEQMVRDYKAHLANTGGEAPAEGESTPIKALTFKVHEDQLEVIRAAIDKAKEEGETDYDGQALELISVSYLNDPNKPPVAKPQQAAPPFDLKTLFESLRKTKGDDALDPIFEALSGAFPDYSFSCEPAES